MITENPFPEIPFASFPLAQEDSRIVARKTAENTCQKLRVLIIAYNASTRSGGEALLPLQYLRLLREQGVDAWLLCHARTRQELKVACRGVARYAYFIPDTPVYQLLYSISCKLPGRLASLSSALLMHLYDQYLKRRWARRIICSRGIQVIHQVGPVSPLLPSAIYDLGVPVIIGPLNGGMEYPPDLRSEHEGFATYQAAKIGRWLSNILNVLIPGKRKAAMLLVANDRTRRAIPRCAARTPMLCLPENGVDLATWRPPETGSRPVESSRIRFVYMGALIRWKMVDLLLEAFLGVSSLCQASLDILGDGVERQRLQRFVHTNRMEDRVFFHGYLPHSECSRVLSSSDVLVLPSVYECGGAVVLEAMAAGLPVIATKWGGPEDYVTPQTGMLVRPGPRTLFRTRLEEAMLILARDPERRHQMGFAGQQRAAELYDWRKKVHALHNLYQTLLRDCGKHGRGRD